MVKHKMNGINWGKARCGATGVKFARSWKDVDCEECHACRNQRKYTKIIKHVVPEDYDEVEKVSYNEQRGTFEVD